MESQVAAIIDVIEEIEIPKKSEHPTYPKNFRGVVSTAKHYIKAGNSTKDIASCIFDELEGADKAIILQALEEGCGLSRVHAYIYHHNILKVQRSTSNTDKFIFETES